MNIVITGASGGIGKAIAENLKGHNLALIYNSNPILMENQLSIKCDLSSEEETKSCFAQIKEKLGGIDVLINNCGISQIALLQDLSLADWDKMLSVNLSSAFLCTKEAIPFMLKNQSGHIINISSIWGQCGASMEASYSASKGGLIAFSKAMSQELAPSNILVNCICPGFIDTAMNLNLSQEDRESFIEQIPLGRAGQPSDIAKTVDFLINQDYITGQVIAVNGGLYI